MVIVDLTLAMICFLGQCHPVLIGEDTKPGTYDLVPRIVAEEVYGGSVLQFNETDELVYSIHRILPGRTLNTSRRRYVTAGCINVSPDVYLQLLDCCTHDKLIIKE